MVCIYGLPTRFSGGGVVEKILLWHMVNESINNLNTITWIDVFDVRLMQSILRLVWCLLGMMLCWGWGALNARSCCASCVGGVQTWLENKYSGRFMIFSRLQKNKKFIHWSLFKNYFLEKAILVKIKLKSLNMGINTELYLGEATHCTCCLSTIQCS